MEIVTQAALTPEEIRSEVPHIIAWLRERQLTRLETMYGVGCGSTAAEWLPMEIALEELAQFIALSERGGLFMPGRSDLWIMTQERCVDGNPKVQVRFCHEADTHVVSVDVEFLEMIKSHWLDNGWRGYQATGGLTSEWTTFP